MKAIIILLLITISVSAQHVKEKIKGVVEIDGHLIDKPVYFEADLEGIKIYDSEGKQYQLRKCEKKECKIIHLQPLFYNALRFNNLIVTPTSNK